MTNKEFFNQVLSLTNDTEMVEFATNAIAKIDAKNASAKAKRVESDKENEPIYTAICQYLANHSKALGAELAEVAGVSTPKAQAMCKKLIERGVLTVEDVKLPKVGIRKAYSLKK